MLLRRGAFQEAERLFVDALDASPTAFLSLTKTRRITEGDRPVIERMRVLAAARELDPDMRLNILFGLGKAFDDLGDYAEAMRCYEAGNGLKAASMRLDRKAMAARYDSIIGRFTADALERERRRQLKMDPTDSDLPVLIVGMPRSGTTLVEQILSSHPLVAAGDELAYWSEQAFGDRVAAIEALDPGVLSEASDAYLGMLRRIGPKARRVTDKAPANYELLWLIRTALPGARIIHCRRDPVDTCLSIFFALFEGRLDYGYDRGDLAFAYRQYLRLMDHWRRTLPPERFLEVDYERIVSEREAETRRLVAFCGLDWDDACMFPERNTRSVKTATLWQARQPVYASSVQRWRRYEPWLGELRELRAHSEEDRG